MHLFVLRVYMVFGWPVALKDSVGSTVLLALSVWGLVLLIRAYPTKAAIYPYSLLLAFIISCIIALVESEALKWWFINTDVTYAQWVMHSLPVRFLFIWLFNTWIATNAALRRNISISDSRFQQQNDVASLLKEAELFKLRQQLQPHFLYNSLNSISALIMIDPDRAQEMISGLSDFLRRSVRRESEDSLPVADELEYIQSYLAIEAVRFGDRLQVTFDKQYPDDASIPPLLLQPIIENAVKFGLYGKTGVVHIAIHIRLDGPVLYITVANPYDAAIQPPRGTGFGLEGIRRRLYLIYARTDLLEVQKDESTFTTVLKIPQHVQSNTDR